MENFSLSRRFDAPHCPDKAPHEAYQVGIVFTDELRLQPLDGESVHHFFKDFGYLFRSIFHPDTLQS